MTDETIQKIVQFHRELFTLHTNTLNDILNGQNISGEIKKDIVDQFVNKNAPPGLKRVFGETKEGFVDIFKK